MNEHKVCLINDSFPPVIDGVSNAVVNYGRIITQNHGAAAVVTPYYPGADDAAFPFPVLRYPSLDMTKAVGYRAGMPFAPELMRKLEGMEFDVIHSHCPITSAMLARALRDRINAPVVLTYHTKFDIDIANAVRSKLLREEAAHLLVQNIAACDEVWTVSRGAGENLRKLGYEGDYIVMPNGVDLPRGRVPDALIAQVTEGFDLPAGVPVFLFVGRMMWYKGIRIILDALKALSESGQAFRMVFVGGGGDKEEIQTYTAGLGLEDRVFFAEPIHDRELIRAWYCRADLFLFPSTFDTNGLVVREAAACGLASVLVEGSCAAEDVTDGATGFLIQENAESMAAMLRELCVSMPAVKQVGQMAQKEIYVSWEEAVARAWERYGVVTENYRLGCYPAHDKLTDNLVHSLAQTMDVLGRAQEKRQQAISELENSVDELKDELKEELDDGRRRMREHLEELTQRLDRFL